MTRRQRFLFAFAWLGLTVTSGAAGQAESEKPSLPKGALLRLVPERAEHAVPVFAVAVSPNGKVIASGGYDEQIRLWDGKTGKELRELQGHKGRILQLALSPDSKYLASVGTDRRTTRLWEVATGQQIREFKGH